jgi:putative nucleotidyltransferase with HDIG domain
VTHDHVRRVQEKSLQLAERLGVRDEAQLQALKAAGLLHDVGKIGIPEHILNKPGRLTPAEFDIMKRHPTIGADILSVIGFPYPLIPIVRHHHENWDGTGYPDRIAGEAIPIGARILQVVDCYDALTSDRPYRRAMSDEDALAIVRDRSGTMYDPRVVRTLLELHAETAPAAENRPRALPASPRAGEPAQTPAGEIPARGAALADARGELAVATDLGAAIARHHDPALAAEAAWAVLREALPATAFVFFVTDGQFLVPVYRGGERTIAPHTRIPVGERLSGWVAATRRTIVNSDARLDFDAGVRDTALCTAMSVPVHVGGETLGVLAFYSDRADVFGDAHVRLAEAAAHAAGGVLQQAPARMARAV